MFAHQCPVEMPGIGGARFGVLVAVGEGVVRNEVVACHRIGGEDRQVGDAWWSIGQIAFRDVHDGGPLSVTARAAAVASQHGEFQTH